MIVQKMSIEEIEFDDAGYWLTTLGFSDPYGLGAFGSKPSGYKLFKIDAT